MENSHAETEKRSRLTSKGKETRARIVAAAAELMFDRGVAGTSVEDVQKAAKVSASQLYHYFKEKRELVLAVIAYQTEAVLQAQQQLLEELDSFEALRAWCDAIIELQRMRQCKGGCPIGSLASELSEQEPEARVELAEGFARWERSIRTGLRSMQERGELAAEADPDRLALGLLASLQGGLLLTQVRRDTEPLRAALDMAFNYIRSFAAGVRD
ncbi:TetR/AcrR family transcriptional regulator [Cohnella thailandensis]|uniref:TetR/AcrR family transcriptional regulator n=1 Tax=Cohnella thailandensis TaxID=557557 RepID=A0A841SPT6_9BACL|nr:TetR/AcrR family transcriptional regulator [Cohnella thailandensis]MBB6632839.1 TetR/AcrR family transcriptional regulator [Cohnella thailandensis]MBP1975467.1 AcrR family transcriptional regulator [Cohnella thailandensis]